MENNMLSNIEEFWNDTVKHVGSYLKVKEDILDNDYLQVAGDVFKVVGFTRDVSKLIMRKKFEYFLKGFNPEEEPMEEKLKKLRKYIDDEAKAEFIADAFTRVLLSRSKKSCMVMGTLLNYLTINKEQLTHDQLICFDALASFFDVDVDNYKVIYEYIVEFSPEKKITHLAARFDRYIESRSIQKSSIWLTIEKTVSSQLLHKIFDVEADFDDDPSYSTVELGEYYQVTGAGELLYRFIDKCQI